MEVFLRDRDMNRKKIEGDGNCLYRTIAYIVYGDENKYADVKRQIFQWMKDKNKEDIVAKTINKESPK